MPKSLLIILSVLVLSIAAPSAHADLYTATFTCTSGTCADADTPTVTDNPVSFPPGLFFDVDVGGVDVGNLAASIRLPTDTYVWFFTPPNVALGFTDYGLFIHNLTGGAGIDDFFMAPPDFMGIDDTGAITFAPGSIPEPSTWAMLLLGFAGLGLLGWRGKKKAQAAAA